VEGKFSEVELRFSRFLRSSSEWSSTKFSAFLEAGLGVLLRKRLIVAYGLHYLMDSCTSHLRVTLVVQQRLVRRPLNYAVDTVGREGGQLVLHFEPNGRLLAGSDDHQRCITQASCSAHLSSGLRGSAIFFKGGGHVVR
jgi:hypothetical protein